MQQQESKEQTEEKVQKTSSPSSEVAETCTQKDVAESVDDNA